MNGLLVGRFQPFHLGHLAALKFALCYVDKLWLGLGSSNRPISKQNPFSTKEREIMIRNSLDDDTNAKISIYDIPDFENHKQWIREIDAIVPNFEIIFSNDPLTRHLYADRNVRVVDIPFLDRDILSGTHIRDLVRENKRWEHLVPDGTKNFLIQNSASRRLKSL